MIHYLGLIVAYSTAMGAWWLLAGRLQLKPHDPHPALLRPWLELLIAIMGVGLVLVIGQLYLAGHLLPEFGFGIAAAINQLLIFSPMLLILSLSPAGLAGGWLKTGKPFRSLGLGLLLGILALISYQITRSLLDEQTSVTMLEVFEHLTLDRAVQVLLEDLSIALLMIRIAAVSSPRIALLLVAALFAAAHIPAMLSQGASLTDLLTLLADIGIGLAVLGTLQKSRNILWFWPVHLAMDLSQFL